MEKQLIESNRNKTDGLSGVEKEEEKGNGEEILTNWLNADGSERKHVLGS